MSNRMRGPTPFKPTPSTCFPPLPPDVFPGFVPCMDVDWGGLSLLKLRVRGDRTGLMPPVPVIDEQSNVATVTRGAGLVAWTTTLNSSVMQRVQIGIRCIDTGYTGQRLQVMLIGTFVMPDFTTINVFQSWGDPMTINIDIINDPRKVVWTFKGQGEYRNPIWTLMQLEATLAEASATSRSRPPNPLIPPLA